MKLRDLFFLLLFSLLTIVVRGYEFGLGNQIHYLTFFHYHMDPGLYPHDFLLKTHAIPYTIFIDFLRFMPLNFFGIQNSIFFIYFVALFFFNLGIFLIVSKLFRDEMLKWIVLCFFIFPIPVGGSSIDTIEKELNPRFIAETFFVLSLYFLIIKKVVVSPLLAAIGFLFNPLTVIPYLFILLLSGFFRHITVKNVLIGTFIFLLIITPLLFKYSINEQQSSFFIDKLWKNILIERVSYIFALRWSLLSWSLAILMGIFLYIYGRFSKMHQVAKAAIIIGFLMFFINIISDIFSLRIGLQLQLTRNLYLPVFFTLIFFAKFLSDFVKKPLSIYLSLFLLSAIFLLSFHKRLPDGILWYRSSTDYEKAAIWARSNTKNESIFLVPVETTGFRFWSLRSVVVEDKEGGDSLYSRSFAMEWDRREDILENNYYHMSLVQIMNLKKQFQINYIVTTQILSLPLQFQSGLWKIYKV